MGKLTDRPDMTIDVYHGRKTTYPLPQTKIYQTTVKQIYTRTIFVGMTAPITNALNQYAIPSSALHKTHFSSLFLLPRIKSLRKQGTEDDLVNAQYDLHYELLLMSVPRGWGGGREV